MPSRCTQGRVLKLRKILRLLTKLHGPTPLAPRGNALDILISSMLTQNTNLANARSGYRQLRRRFSSWNKLMNADVGDVQRCIAVCGLARMRARRLQNLLRIIHARRGKLDLQFLAELPPGEAFDYLMGFFGIGPKTAACTLLFAFHMPLFPVDKGIHRIARRLALVRAKAGEVETAQIIQKMLTPSQCYPLHLLMFAHAKRFCRTRNPKCGECVLRELCPFGRRRVKHRPPEQVIPLTMQTHPRRLARFISAGIPKHADPDDSL